MGKGIVFFLGQVFFYIRELQLQGMYGQEDFPKRENEGNHQQDKADDKDKFTEEQTACKEGEQAKHAEKEAGHPTGLHIADQVDPFTQGADLADNDIRGRLSILGVQNADAFADGSEAGGVGHQQEGDGRKEQGRRGQGEIHLFCPPQTEKGLGVFWKTAAGFVLENEFLEMHKVAQAG